MKVTFISMLHTDTYPYAGKAALTLHTPDFPPAWINENSPPEMLLRVAVFDNNIRGVLSGVNAKEILSFIREAKNKNFDIVVNCEAGMSRSAGVAKFINDFYEYELNLNHPCIGTLDYYNPAIYNDLVEHDDNVMTLAKQLKQQEGQE